MDILEYITKLNAICAMSEEFKSYLRTTTVSNSFNKGQKLMITQNFPKCYSLIIQGKAKVVSIDDETRAQTILGFYFEDDFLTPSGLMLPGVNELHLIFIEQTTTLSIESRHFFNIMRLYPEAHALQVNFVSQGLSHMLLQLLIRNKYSAEERYRKVIEIQPKINKEIKIKDIANFLGVDKTTLSRIRSKKKK